MFHHESTEPSTDAPETLPAGDGGRRRHGLPDGRRRRCQAPNRLSEAERRGGWRLLFDGTSADAFRTYHKASLNAGWQVRDRPLVWTAKRAGDIVTRDQFGAFKLQLEYRIAACGNSGVMFHVTEDEPQPRMTGPKVQILDNAAGKNPQRAGWPHELYPPTRPDWVRKAEQGTGHVSPDFIDAARLAGEWNHLALLVAPTGCPVAVNGVVSTRFTNVDDEWRARVAKSKGAAFPKFRVAERGHICLQDHGNEQAFRSIKVRELPAAEGPTSFKDGIAAVEAVPAFPAAVWEGWSPESDGGSPVVPLRPLALTHAGDGTGRRFVLEK